MSKEFWVEGEKAWQEDISQLDLHAIAFSLKLCVFMWPCPFLTWQPTSGLPDSRNLQIQHDHMKQIKHCGHSTLFKKKGPGRSTWAGALCMRSISQWLANATLFLDNGIGFQRIYRLIPPPSASQLCRPETKEVKSLTAISLLGHET